jgi:hypothetical protein
MLPSDVLAAMADEAEGITCHDQYPTLYFVCTLPVNHEGDHEDHIRDAPNTVAWEQ